MKYGICNLGVIPLRKEADDRSEQVSQLLYGEIFTINKEDKHWYHITLDYDQYSGWIDSKQCQLIDVKTFELLKNTPSTLAGELIDYISNTRGDLILTPIGSELTYLKIKELNINQYNYDGKTIKKHDFINKTDIIRNALQYLNTPYLWGGRTPFGIDCSGFTQMVYKLSGISLPRDASMQVKTGTPLSFIEECEAGDLAFFDNEQGHITHVGIIMENNFIIHASGKVKIDQIDHLGIFDTKTNQHTHRLRILKRLI